MSGCGSGLMRALGRGFEERAGAALLAMLLLAACAAPKRPTTTATACPALEQPPGEIVCLADRDLQSLSARFRADVQTTGGSQTAEGILLVKRPGAIRVKLFGPAGMTVHDATWKGDASSVRGVVQRPMRGDPLVIELGPKDAPVEPEAELSLALWALFQARCAGAVEEKPGEAGWFFVDPRSAHAITRAARVGPQGVEEELLVRKVGDPPQSEHLVARYKDFDCSGSIALPQRIELVSAERGWSAKVTILSQETNPTLDEKLFQLPAEAASR